MSFFIKAVVDALQAVPSINAQLEGDELVENHFYDIGVAVGTDKGLMVPVVRDCDKKSFAEIGEVVIRPMMYLALSYDHRIVDGKEAVTFLVRVKECLENPERMLLGA
ncbi:UNVERIFIED_CONTAM: hypothetical protein GTU68_042291 [Idotea baltica]|nr:hypothetical protein [Idotea baltica]